MSSRILVVEDDPATRAALEFLLTNEGFVVDTADDGDTGLERFRTLRPDLVLVDLALPTVSGWEVCRRICAQSDVPVVVVTARDSEVDRVVAFGLGADDYITKPYSRAELVARVRAVLRRPVRHETDQVVLAGPLRLDPARHEVTVRGRPVYLPAREFQLLEMLVRNLGRVLSREQLYQLWGPRVDPHSKTLEVHIKRIRGRIEESPHHPRHLLTVRGLGYKFVP